MDIYSILILIWVIFSTVYTFEGLAKKIKKMLTKPKKEPAPIVTAESGQAKE